MTCNAEADRPAHAGDRDTDEIEITLEMIAAGAAELAAFNPDYQSLEDGAERILREMLRATRVQECACK